MPSQGNSVSAGSRWLLVLPATSSSSDLIKHLFNRILFLHVFLSSHWSFLCFVWRQHITSSQIQWNPNATVTLILTFAHTPLPRTIKQGMAYHGAAPTASKR